MFIYVQKIKHLRISKNHRDLIINILKIIGTSFETTGQIKNKKPYSLNSVIMQFFKTNLITVKSLLIIVLIAVSSTSFANTADVHETKSGNTTIKKT